MIATPLACLAALAAVIVILTCGASTATVVAGGVTALLFAVAAIASRSWVCGVLAGCWVVSSILLTLAIR